MISPKKKNTNTKNEFAPSILICNVATFAITLVLHAVLFVIDYRMAMRPHSCEGILPDTWCEGLRYEGLLDYLSSAIGGYAHSILLVMLLSQIPFWILWTILRKKKVSSRSSNIVTVLLDTVFGIAVAATLLIR